MTEQTKKKSDLSATQKHHLAKAVKRAYDQGWDGSGPNADHAPKLFGSSWSTTGVPLGTRQALEVRGYLTKKGSAWPLTAKAIEAGEEAYLENTGRSAGLVAAELQDQKETEKAERVKRRKELAHPFRGLKVPDHNSEEEGATRSLQELIENSSGGFELSEAGLEMVGKGIEKLRVKSVKSRRKS